jgi:hypothetical protein
LVFLSLAFALVFRTGMHGNQSTAIMLAEAASEVPEVRARWTAVHLKISTLAMDAWGEVSGASEDGTRGGLSGNAVVSDDTEESIG